MFHDPLDSAADGNDQTYYDEAYVFKVFRTCDARNGSWDDRDDIADCIWCLERDVNEDVHDNHFPGLSAPDDVRESAVEPATWNLAHIRNMWLQNIGS